MLMLTIAHSILGTISIIFLCFIYALRHNKEINIDASLKKRYFYILKTTYCIPILVQNQFVLASKSNKKSSGLCTVPRFLLGLYITVFSFLYTLIYKLSTDTFSHVFDRYIHINLNLYLIMVDASFINRLIAFTISYIILAFVTLYLYRALYMLFVKIFQDKAHSHVEELNKKRLITSNNLSEILLKKSRKNIVLQDTIFLTFYSNYFIKFHDYIVPPYWFWVCIFFYIFLEDGYRTCKDFIINLI
jgi:hypothetical protein